VLNVQFQKETCPLGAFLSFSFFLYFFLYSADIGSPRCCAFGFRLSIEGRLYPNILIEINTPDIFSDHFSPNLGE
jgi:hypothetical protein